MRGELRDALEFLFPDSDVGSTPRDVADVHVARGGTIAVHILLNGLTRKGVLRLRVSHAGRPVREARWFRLRDVPVEVNTGPAAFVEREGEINPHVIRRAPFRVYDAMEPAGTSCPARNSTTALRLHIPVERDAATGQREYTIEIRYRAFTLPLLVVAHIHPAMIPPVGPATLPYTNWFNYDLMAARHGLKPWSEAHWTMIRRYAEVMVHARQNTFWVPQSVIFVATSKGPVLRRERLHRIVGIFTRAGMHFIEGGHFATRTGGDWNASTFELHLTKQPATSGEGNRTIAGISRQLLEEIEVNGWQDRWIQHIADEPIRVNAADYRILTGMVRKYMPGIPILDATMDPALAGSVNIWCPKAHDYEKDRPHFEAQRKLGDRVWVYTCCDPGGPWLNRLLDTELLRPALLGWGIARYRLDGFLHWGLNHYRKDQDPFKRSVVPLNADNRLPAGDTHIVYPGANGPWSSLRLEAQREGFEDCELLRLLRERDEKAANAVIRKTIRGFSRFTKQAAVFRAARKCLLEAL